MLKYIQLVMFSVFVIGGLTITLISLKGLNDSHQASSWDTVQGKLTDLKIKTSLGSRSLGRATTSSRHLEYSYIVENKKYSGNKEYFGIVMGTNNETSGGYLENSSVEVYYDPKNPINSALEPQNRRSIWFGFIMGFVFSGFGVFGISKTKKNHNKLLHRKSSV